MDIETYGQLFLLLFIYGWICRWIGYRRGFKAALREFDNFPVWIRNSFNISPKEGYVCWEQWRDRKMPDSSGDSEDVSQVEEVAASELEEEGR